MQATESQRLRHLLRRFGLGATPDELAVAERLGVNKTIDGLIASVSNPKPFSVNPWEFTVGQNAEQFNVEPNRLAAWWAMRMVATDQPAVEKLALFWHDHFAVSAAKVESFPAMEGYLATLHRLGGASFRQLLGAVTRDAAMLRWLDTDLSIVGKPNENFAREVLELFTVGIGHYTEKDIQELARAFTGWSLRIVFPNGTVPARKQYVAECLKMGRPLVASSYSEGFHDSGPKTILGKTAAFDTESALDLLASHPQTSRHLCGKLWSFYAYRDPEPAVIERLMKVWQQKKGDVASLLLAIATSKEFWSDKAMRAQVKSPMDFVVPPMRQLGLGRVVLALRPESDDPMTPVPPAMLQFATSTYGLMARMGMRLLYPPDVDGWAWGDAWISPAMMLERLRFGDVMLSRGRQAIGKAYLDAIGPCDSLEAFVDRAAALLDFDVTPEKRAILVEAAQKGGGLEALSRPQTAVNVVQQVSRLIYGAPEYQLC